MYDHLGADILDVVSVLTIVLSSGQCGVPTDCRESACLGMWCSSVALMILRASALGSSEASLKTCSRPGIGGWVHRRCCPAWCMLPHLMWSGLIIWTGSPHPCRDRNPHPPVCVMLCKQSKSARRSPDLGPGKLCLMCILLLVVSSEVDVRFGHHLSSDPDPPRHQVTLLDNS